MGQKSHVVDPKKISETCRMVQKSDVILLEEVLHQAVVVNCSIVLLKDPVITTQTRALSQEGCLLQHVHIASRRLMPLHNLKTHDPIEGKSTHDHDGASSTVPRRKHLQWDLLVMPVMLEAIRTIQVKISHQRIKLSSTFQCPMFGALLQIPNWQVCGVGGDEAFEDVFCSLSPSLADAVLWLLGCSQHQ